MPIFQCQKCGCVENTALSNHAWRTQREQLPPVCSACDPEIGQWHGAFPREQAAGNYLLGEDGFLYAPADPARHTRIIGPVPELRP